MLVQNLRAPLAPFVKKMNLKFIKLSTRKIDICGKKYTIAQELDIQVFRGQMDILVYKSIADLFKKNHEL